MAPDNGLVKLMMLGIIPFGLNRFSPGSTLLVFVQRKASIIMLLFLFACCCCPCRDLGVCILSFCCDM